jgi:hypothetical protein
VHRGGKNDLSSGRETRRRASLYNVLIHPINTSKALNYKYHLKIIDLGDIEVSGPRRPAVVSHVFVARCSS